MHDEGKALLNLMFRPDETVCVSDDKYGYHSMPLSSAFESHINLVSPNQKIGIRSTTSDLISMAALNPILGFREDANCYKYRNFLVEMDMGALSSQLEYIKKLKMPYSAVVFSGNKSLHFLISLSIDLPDEDTYRHFSRWILNIVTLADQNTQNPSRSIRVPGPIRSQDKRQGLVDLVGPVDIKDMVAWLNAHPNEKPIKHERQEMMPGALPSFIYRNKNKWIRDALDSGLDSQKGRNKQWFSIACEFVLNGIDLDDTLSILGPYFIPDRDFKEREWKGAIKSAYKHVKARK